MSKFQLKIVKLLAMNSQNLKKIYKTVKILTRIDKLLRKIRETDKIIKNCQNLNIKQSK